MVFRRIWTGQIIWCLVGGGMPAEQPTKRQDQYKLDKLRQAHQQRKRANGTTTMWTLQKLENIQYVADKDNFIRYSTPLIANRISGGSIFRSSYRKIVRGELNRMTWKNIAICADVMGVPAELLVDEEYYYSRCGLAGYRVVFEAHRKGVSLAELTYYPGQSDHPKYQYSWYSLWYMFLKGSLNLQKYLNLQHLTTIIHLCNERLGTPLGALVGRMLHHNAEGTGVVGELVDVLLGLDERDCVLVAGVAQALHNNKVCKLSLREQVAKLLEWYEDEQTSEGA